MSHSYSSFRMAGKRLKIANTKELGNYTIYKFNKMHEIRLHITKQI